MSRTGNFRALPLGLMFALVAVAALGGCTMPFGQASHQPALLLSLPKSCNTPDGMTLAPTHGDIILSCPNFNDPNYPGVLVKIDVQNRLTPFFTLPTHPETGKAGPMGLDFGPDGHLYVADNQYFSNPDHKSRLIRVRIQDGKPVGAEVAVDGFKLANAVVWRGDAIFVSDTFFDLKDKPGMSGIYRFTLAELDQGTVHLKPNATDPHLIAKFQTVLGRGSGPAGADGMTLDSKGNLYTGNFGDGVMSRITFDAEGKVASQEEFVKHPRLTCVDGIFCDLSTDEIYVADSQKNAIQVVSPDGKLRTLWENDDTDGTGGLLDQPCEVILRGNELIIANFDMPFPGLRNRKFDAPYTISVIKLK